MTKIKGSVSHIPKKKKAYLGRFMTDDFQRQIKILAIIWLTLSEQVGHKIYGSRESSTLPEIVEETDEK
jgi:hypothetical protein